jgi:peptide deformylase
MSASGLAASEMSETLATMTRLPIIIAPDVRLKQRAGVVDQVDAEVRRQMDDLLETMYAANGIGLAGPQVGLLKRIIVIDVSGEEQPRAPLRMANPEILWRSDTLVAGEEGCLSLPDHFAEVTRPDRIRVRFLDAANRVQELEADGLLAKCIQHEIDHLDGILFVDHLSALRRGIILRKLTKIKKQLAVAS